MQDLKVQFWASTYVFILGIKRDNNQKCKTLRFHFISFKCVVNV